MTEYGTGELCFRWLMLSVDISFDTDDEYESVESEDESIERYIEVVVALFCKYCPVGNLALFEIVEIDCGEPGELGSS